MRFYIGQRNGKLTVRVSKFSVLYTLWRMFK